MARYRIPFLSALPILGALIISSTIPGLSESAAAQSAEKPLNVVIVTFDAMRADRLNLYGNPRTTTPYLNEIAQEAAVFENFFAVSAHTSPGVVSLLTGQVPPVHAQTSAFAFFDSLIDTPIRELKKHGYKTFGFVNSGANYENLGFDTEIKDRPFSKFLDDHAHDETPFIAWFHTREVHLPYRPHAAAAGKFTGHLQARGTIQPLDTPLLKAAQQFQVILKNKTPEVTFPHAEAVPITQGDDEALRALYDECVLSADLQIESWLTQMRKNGLLERTIVVLTADHGDELLEHGWLGHASTNYDGKLTDEILHIPMIIRFPGGRYAGRYRALASQVDLMPTLFEFLQISNEALKEFQQGVSMLPVLRGSVPNVRDSIFAESTFKGWTAPRNDALQRVSAIRSRSQKFVSIFRAGGEVASAFDLKADPGEKKDRWESEPRLFDELQTAFVKSGEQFRATAGKMILTAANRHLVAISEAISRGDRTTEGDHRRALENLKKTWGMERFSPFAKAPFRDLWAQIENRATAAAPR